MKHFYKLNLPSNPLNAETSHKILKVSQSDKVWYKNPHWHTYADPEIIKEVLTPEVLSSLHALDLDPTLVIVFFMTKEVTPERSYIHKDTSYINGQWVTVPFGINFEVNPTTVSTTTWWNTTDQPEYLDDNEQTREFKKELNGYRYHKDFLRSTPKYLNFNPVDSITLQGNSTSLLFRTDVAHSVITKTEEGIRFNVSLRFDINKISTFEQAVEILQPLFIGSSNTN